MMAVEIHQQAADSSDISFDAELVGLSAGSTETLDGDDDGLYDDWEVEYYGSTEAALPYVDSDLDGVWNIDEFVAGTLPDDENSYFVINGFNGSEISWAAVSGRVYSVYWTDDLLQPFVLLDSDAEGGSYTDTQNTTNSVGFYQITVELE